jgi:hypothetical protein
LTAALFQRKSLLAAIDPSLGKYLTVSVAYRGKLSMRDIENAVYDFQNKNSAHFVPWVSWPSGKKGQKADDQIPNSSLTTLCTVPPLGGQTSATLVANTTAISGMSADFIRVYEADYCRGLPAIARAIPKALQKEGVHPLVHWRGNVSDSSRSLERD